MLMIDGRVGSQELIALVPPEIPVTKTELWAGDVAFFGNGPDGTGSYPIGIEFKTAKECLGAMLSGRLVAEQLPKLSMMYKRVYLLIEGEYSSSDTGVLQFRTWKGGKPGWTSFGNTSYRQFDTWQDSVLEASNVTIKRSITRQESMDQIINLYYLWTKDYDSHKSVLKFDKSHQPTLIVSPSTKRLIAAQIPGIGWELSGRAAEHFSTPKEMINAEADEWMKIQGIAKKKAQTIVKSLNSTH